MVYNNSKKGSQGIGTLIIFIAMILVAAVAAGVLIQTASSLQSKSLDVGRQSQQKITTDMDVVQVYAANTNDSTIGAVDNVTMIIRLGSGSSVIDLRDLTVKMDTVSGSQTLSFNSSGSGFSQASYGVTYITNGSSHVNGYLSAGDLAQVTFTNANVIGQSQTATLRLLTKNGAVKPIDMTTPSAMTQVTTYLYP